MRRNGALKEQALLQAEKRRGQIGRKWSPSEKAAHSITMKRVMSNPEARANISRRMTGRSMSEESRKKLSESARKATLRTIAEGRHVPWQSRPKGTASYPEVFWMKVFDTAELDYEFNYPISKPNSKSRYFLDFAFVNKDGQILDFEVDGKQHKYPERAESDLARDAYLQTLGIKIHRKDWTTDRDELHSQVLELQTILSSFLGTNIQLTQ